MFIPSTGVVIVRHDEFLQRATKARIYQALVMVIGNHNISRVSQHVHNFWEYGIVWGVNRKESRIRQRHKLTKTILRTIHIINIGYIIYVIQKSYFFV